LPGDHARPIGKPIAGALNRCSVSIMSREVKRSSPRPSFPSATSSGEVRTALITGRTDPCRRVAERELRQVAPRERRLLARDRIERDLRIGDDLLAILARDPGMVLDPLGLKPLFGHPRRVPGPILCCG
jgi:hypothetical protein